MSARADFLLEIGCEDLPTAALTHLLGSLKREFDASMDAAHLSATSTSVTLGTARRLVLVVRGMNALSNRDTVITYGPPEVAGRDASGNWTKAAIGFAGKCGVAPEQLVLLDKDNKKVWAYKYELPAEETGAVLSRIIPEVLQKIAAEYPRTMRWGDSRVFAFPRPIRWITTILGESTVEFDWLPLKSGNTSYGHRFLSPAPFTVTSVDQYMGELKKRHVVLDGKERRDLIRTQGDLLAKNLGLSVGWEEELLDVVSDQVESPQVLIGDFSPEYATLPRKMIEATLEGYQKYFPLEDKDGKIAPHFLAIYDSATTAAENVRRGNAAALASRLADARFFFEHDKATGLAKMRAATAGRGYLPGLGTVLDKSERLIKLSEFLADEVEKANPGLMVDHDALREAAFYCKADLESAVVGEKEFAHLQGEMGYHYALAEGLHGTSALAIREHYAPRGAGDPPAGTMEGRILALADKLDHVAACHIIGKAPSGGDDPLGVRRAALGIIVNLLGHNLPQTEACGVLGIAFSLFSVMTHAYKVLGRNATEADAAVSFIRTRFVNLVAEQTDLRADYLRGIEAQHGDNIALCYQRMRVAWEAINELAEWQPLAEAAKRCRNILDAASRDGLIIGSFAAEHLVLLEEKKLAETLASVRLELPSDDQIGSEMGHFRELAALRDPLHEFFAKVFVMDPDTIVRDNRLGLLNAVYGLLSNIMDFSKVEIVTKDK